MAITVQVQMSPGCGHGEKTVALVRDVLDRIAPGAPLEIVEVSSLDDAERLGFPGSPTVRVNGVDVEPEPPRSVGLG
ncbi:MAG TPA: hypothetical protein VF841_04690 [Anaeromyxobacter sp.]